jgi:hypothetical protein
VIIFQQHQVFYQSNGDINKARDLVDKTIKLNRKTVLYLRLKSLIQAKQGDKKRSY